MATNYVGIGRFFTDTPANIVTLFAGASASLSYDSFKQGNVAYQVPAGKTMYVLSIEAVGSSTALFGLATSTASIVNAAGPPAGLVSLSVSGSTAYANFAAPAGAATYSMCLPIATGLYFNYYAITAGGQAMATCLVF